MRHTSFSTSVNFFQDQTKKNANITPNKLAWNGIALARAKIPAWYFPEAKECQMLNRYKIFYIFAPLHPFGKGRRMNQNNNKNDNIMRLTPPHRTI